MSQRRNILHQTGWMFGLFLIVLLFSISISFKARKLSFLKAKPDSTSLDVIVKAKVDHADTFQLFYHRGTSYSEDKSIHVAVPASTDFLDVVFHIPAGDGLIRKIRIDPGENRGVIRIKSIILNNSITTNTLLPADITQQFIPNQSIGKAVYGSESLFILSEGGDPILDYKGDLSEVLTTMYEISSNKIYIFSFFIALLICSALFFIYQADKSYLSRVLFFSLMLFEVLYAILQSVSYEPLKNSIIALDSTYVQMEVKVQHTDHFQLFYDHSAAGNFSEQRSVSVAVDSLSDFQLITLALPPGDLPKTFRIDPGTVAQDKIQIRSITLSNEHENYFWNAKEILSRFKPTQHISHFILDGDVITIYTYDKDPSITLITPLSKSPDIHPVFPLIVSLLIYTLTVATFITRTSSSNKRQLSVLTFVFLLIIFLPTLSYLSSHEEDDSNENRRLAEHPEFKFPDVLKYPQRFTVYFEDHFSFRSLLVKANGYLKVKLFGVSPLPEKVLVGNRDWLFLSGDKVIDDFIGTDSLSEESLAKIRENLKKKVEWFNKRGIKYYLIIFPEKSQIYPEYLPSTVVKKHKTSKYDQLVSFLKNDTSIIIIDVRNTLLQAKQDNKNMLYYKSDTHWNDRGAFEAYKEIINVIGKDFPNANPGSYLDYSVTEGQTVSGDLSRLVSLKYADACPIFVPNFPNPAGQTPYSYPSYKGVEVIATQSLASSQPKLVMYRDSFTIALLPFLSQNFSNSIFLWTPNFDYDMMETEKPNIVIQGIVERYIYLLESP